MTRHLLVSTVTLSLFVGGLAGCDSSVTPDAIVVPDTGTDMRPDTNPPPDRRPDVVPPDDTDMVVTPDDGVTPPGPRDCSNPVGADEGTATSNGVIFEGDTSGADGADAEFGTCVPGPGSPEIVHSYTLPSGASFYRVVASTDDAATAFDSVVYLRTACGERFSQVACDDDSGNKGRSVATARVAGGTTLFVFVDGKAGAAGAYRLTVTATPIAGEGETCDPAGVTSVCDDAYACIDSGSGPTCTLTSEPILFGLRAYRFPNGTMRMVFQGSDAEGNVADGLLTAFDANGDVAIDLPSGQPVEDFSVLPFDPPGINGQTVFTASVTSPQWFNAVAPTTASVMLELVDATGNHSNALTTAVTTVDVRGLGEPCDPRGFDSVCGGKGVCTTAGGASTCQAPNAAAERCAAADAGTAVDPSTRFEDTVQVRPDAADGVFEGSCSKEAGFAEVLYKVVVPAGTTGKDLVAHTVFQDQVLDSYIYIRAECGNPASELVCHDDINPSFTQPFDWHSVAALNDVTPGTYYVFVDTSQENGVNSDACDFATACPSGSCECVDQTNHVAIYLRPVVASGQPCDTAGLDNRCAQGTTCTGTGATGTCTP